MTLLTGMIHKVDYTIFQMKYARLIYAISIRLWRWGKVLNWLAKLPVVGPLFQKKFFDPADSQAVIIPVNTAIQQGEHTVLPYVLLPELIEQASHRAILNHCMCRQGENCPTYPQDLGCLFLGQGATRIDPTLGHQVTPGEARAHVEEAMQLGLTPTMLHAKMDAFMLQIPFRRMLAICFCCDCCCTIRQGMRLGPAAYWETVQRLPGLSVTVNKACTGCGVCLEACPVQAITLVHGHAVINNACKGCGRCAAICPAEALTLHIDPDTDVVARLRALIAARTDIG